MNEFVLDDISELVRQLRKAKSYNVLREAAIEVTVNTKTRESTITRIKSILRKIESK